MADTKFTSKWTGNEIDSGINIARNLTATGNIVITTTGSDDSKDKVTTIGTTCDAKFTNVQANNISGTTITGTTGSFSQVEAKYFYVGASSTTGVRLTNTNTTDTLKIELPAESGTLALKSDIVPVPSTIVESIGGKSGELQLGSGLVWDADDKLTSLVYYQYALKIEAPDQGIIIHSSFISSTNHDIGEEINYDTLKTLINGGLYTGCFLSNEVYRGNCYISMDSTNTNVTATIPSTADESITYQFSNPSTQILGKSQLNI